MILSRKQALDAQYKTRFHFSHQQQQSGISKLILKLSKLFCISGCNKMNANLKPLDENEKVKIQSWLAKLFGDEDIPPFEENDEDMQLLQSIMYSNLEREKDINELIKLEQNSAEIYNKRADELASFLDCGIISPSADTLKKIKSLASLAVDMNLKDPTLINFHAAFTDAAMKKMDQELDEKINNFHLNSLSGKITSTMKTNEILRRDLRVLKEIVESQQIMDPALEKEKVICQRKEKEYEYFIKKHEKQLDLIRCMPSLYHHSLDQRSKEIDKLEASVKNLISQLDVYESLPPNETLTVLKIKEAQEELEVLNEEFQNLLDSVTET